MANPNLRKDTKIVNTLMAGMLLLSYRVPNTVLSLLKRLLFKKWQDIAVKKIIILRQGGLGDSVSSMDAILTIKQNFPSASIDLLTHQKLENRTSIEDVFTESPFNTIYRYKSFPDTELIKILMNCSYDLYIELPSYLASFSFELKSIWFAKKIKAKAAFGWQFGSHTLFKKWQEKLFIFERDASRQMNILKHNGLLSDNILFEKPSAIANDLIFEKYAIPQYKRRIVLIIGAGRPQNQWPIETFLKVAKHYLAKDYTILLIGGEKESGLAKQYFQTPGVINLCGRLNPMENMDVMKLCALVISNDTGPMHLAWKVGTPLIVIYSGRDYSNKWYPPESSLNIILRNEKVPCFTCFSNTCAYNICMKSITVAEVIEKADTLLQLSQ